jgi:hypothetical protein
MSSHGLVEMISEFSMRSLISSRANPTSKKTKTRPVARCSAFHATAEGPLPQGKIASARSRRPLHLLNSETSDGSSSRYKPHQPWLRVADPSMTFGGGEAWGVAWCIEPPERLDETRWEAASVNDVQRPALHD